MEAVYSADLAGKLSQEKWDAIVIGSGIGGLTTAVLLAKAGRRVLVLERHTVSGGFSHTFTRKGFEWDVGVHYVGKMGASIFRQVADVVTHGRLQWAKITPIHDRNVIAGRVFDSVAGEENQIAKLIEEFPGEADAIHRYFKLVKAVIRATPWYFGEKTLPPWLSQTLGRILRRPFERLARKTTDEVLRSLTQNEDLIATLATLYSVYGLPPKQSSFAQHALAVDHYVEGAYYPIGGAGEIHRSLVWNFTRHGGWVVLRADVEAVVVENGRAVGVRLKGGCELRSSIVVSGVGARVTFNQLLPSALGVVEKMRTRLAQIAPSTAHVCLYIGLDASDADLQLPAHNTWIFDDRDFDRAHEFSITVDGAGSEAVATSDIATAPKLTCVSTQSAKDPSWPRRHPGKSAMQVICPVPFSQFQQWRDSKWMKRPESYLALKRRLTDQLLRRLYETYPQTFGHVKHFELSTPLSTQHFMGNETGEIYGLEHSPRRFLASWLRPQTPIKGLYLTGVDVSTVGVAGAFFSGVFTAFAINGTSFFWNMLKAQFGRSSRARERSSPGQQKTNP